MSLEFVLNGNSILLLGLLVVIVLFVFKMKDWPVYKTVLFSSFVIYLCVIASYTLFPIPITPSSISQYQTFYAGNNIFSLSLNSELNHDMLLNILMTIPLGVYFKVLFDVKKMSITLLLGLFCSLIIETTQLCLSFLFQIELWVFDINDLITNTLGAGIGFVLILFLLNKRHFLIKRINH